MTTHWSGPLPNLGSVSSSGGWKGRILEMLSDPVRGAANWAIPGERFDIPSPLPVDRISQELTGYNLNELFLAMRK